MHNLAVLLQTMDTDGDPNNDELFFEERAMRTREEALSALYEALDLCP